MKDVNTCSKEELETYQQLKLGQSYYVTVVGFITMPDGKKLKKVMLHPDQPPKTEN
jgi:hypothetical protein